MNDDWASFIFVSLLLGCMLYLCIYLQNLAQVKKDWVNLKCNPLYMLINSLTDDNESSIGNFKNCVNNV